jgi:hypothetical protein
VKLKNLKKFANIQRLAPSNPPTKPLLANAVFPVFAVFRILPRETDQLSLFLVLGTWYLVLGTWYLVLGTWYLVLGTPLAI